MYVLYGQYTVTDYKSWNLFFSFKFTGFGVDQLRDDSNDTYWQSDGPQPHTVSIQFRRKTTVQDVCLYADYKADESYTPNRWSNNNCVFKKGESSKLYSKYDVKAYHNDNNSATLVELLFQ